MKLSSVTSLISIPSTLILERRYSKEYPIFLNRTSTQHLVHSRRMNCSFISRITHDTTCETPCSELICGMTRWERKREDSLGAVTFWAPGFFIVWSSFALLFFLGLRGQNRDFQEKLEENRVFFYLIFRFPSVRDFFPIDQHLIIVIYEFSHIQNYVQVREHHRKVMLQTEGLRIDNSTS